jgi:hypothetical protein
MSVVELVSHVHASTRSHSQKATNIGSCNFTSAAMSWKIHRFYSAQQRTTEQALFRTAQ